MQAEPALPPEDTAVLTKRLFSPGQIGLAALLGGPGAAGWFIAWNERQLDRPANGSWWLWGSVLGTLLLLVAVVLLPVHFPRQSLAIGYVAGFYAAAKQLYGTLLKAHRTAGGPVGSWWVVVGVGLLFLLTFLALTFLIVFLLPASVTDKFIPPIDS